MTWGLVGAGLLAFAWGIWVGRPRRYTQSLEEIDKVMDAGGRRRPRSKQQLSPLAWLHRNVSARGSLDLRKGRGGSGFRIEAPDDE